MSGLDVKWNFNRYLAALVSAALVFAALFFCRSSLAFARPSQTSALTLGQGSKPSMLADKRGCLHAFFISTTGQSNDIVCVNSLANALSFSQPVIIAKINSQNILLSAALEPDGALALLWTDQSNTVEAGKNAFFFSRSKDGGTNWSAPLRLAIAAAYPAQAQMVIGASGQLALVWCEKGADQNQSLFYTYSNDSGFTFAPPIKINQSRDSCSFPSLALASDESVHIVWLSKNSAKDLTDVFYTYSQNNFDFSAEKNEIYKVSAGAKITLHPLVSAGLRQRIYIAWTDNSARADSADLWCVTTKVGGKITLPINLSNTAGLCASPSLAADQKGRVAAVWSDASYGRPDVFGRVSVDNLGDVSYAIDLSCGQKSGTAQDPFVVLMQGRAYVVWDEAIENRGERQNVIKLTWLDLKDFGTGAGFDIHFKAARKLRAVISH